MRQAYTLSLMKFNAGVLANCCRVRKTLTPVQIMLFAGSVSQGLLPWVAGWNVFAPGTNMIHAQQEY
jgi:hypothetical protein